MKFLIDAQLPARLAVFLNNSHHDAIHTSSLPDGNRSTDNAITEFADDDGRIVVTKDADFRNSHLLRRSPRRLLVVATGNINNDALLKLIGESLPILVDAFDRSDYVQLLHTTVVAHPRQRT